MKRISILLPLLGLALVIAAITARSLRRGGLELDPFESPRPVAIPGVSVPIGDERIAGIVRGASGEAVAEAIVRVLVGDEPVWDYTDDEGRFALEGLHAGEHRVHIWSRRYHHQAFNVAAPDEETVLVLDEEFGPILTLPKIERATLHGELTPALGGQVLKGYEVLFLAAEPLEQPGAAFERRATVGADRKFVLPDLALAEYLLLVIPPWARGANSPNLAARDERHYTHTRGGAERGLSIELEMGSIQGLAFDEDGRAVRGALAVVHPSGRPSEPWPTVLSDEDGTFSLGDLPPGGYRLSLRAGEAVVEREVQVESGNSHRLDLPALVLRRAAEAEDVDEP